MVIVYLRSFSGTAGSTVALGALRFAAVANLLDLGVVGVVMP